MKTSTFKKLISLLIARGEIKTLEDFAKLTGDRYDMIRKYHCGSLPIPFDRLQRYCERFEFDLEMKLNDRSIIKSGTSVTITNETQGFNKFC